MTNETNKRIERAAEAAISRAEQIDIPGATISAWCDFGGADEHSAPIVVRVTLDDSDDGLPSKRGRVEDVVRALWQLEIHAVDCADHLGKYLELYHTDEVSEATESVKICGFVNI